jgi:hypothetical protein
MAIAALALGVLEALVYAGVLAFEAAGLHL